MEIKQKIVKRFAKTANLFIFSCFFVYFISIAVKVAYSAQMIVMIDFFGSTKTQVSLGLTIYYIIYAATQTVIVPFIKKINVRRYMAVTIMLSSAIYFLALFTNELWQMWAIMAANGILQAGIWGGCIHFLGKYLPDEYSSRVTNVMGAGLPVGMAAAYGVSSFFTAFAGWQYTFFSFRF